ncbi:MAG: type I-E CRISPR-associated protein Cse2/CasB [Methylococcales bacterium]|nr:type I-E CRISPR-associated protein Cse2/CasB [Methylococcales bacterium]
MSSEAHQSDKSERFVEFTIRQCLADKGLVAALKRADNPATEFQSWAYLAGFSIALDNDKKRLPYAAIAAAIARAGSERNGRTGIGRAIALCYEEGNNSDQARIKLRRLLCCDTVEDVCGILRPLFGLIDSRVAISLDYVRLLSNLRYFETDSQAIKRQWAQDFYNHAMEDREVL